MIKVEIELDEEKILREGIYNVEQLYKDIDTFFVENGAVRCEPTENGVAYCGIGKETDMALLGSINCELDENNWFANNVKRWEWFIGINDDSEIIKESWLERGQYLALNSSRRQ